MTEFLYINEALIKNMTPLETSVEPALIKNSIIFAQDANIIPALGTVLHNTLQAELLANTLSSNNQILVEDYIWKAHIAWTLYYCQFNLLVKQRNRALTTNSAEFAQPVSESLLNKAEEKALIQAEFYQQRLTDYLQANTDLYPSYLLSTGKSDNVDPQTNNYFAGIYLPDDNWCNCSGSCNCNT